MILQSVEIKSERDRMFLLADDQDDMKEAIDRLPHIFGIQSFSPVAKCEATLEAIKSKAFEVIGSDETEGKTFKVEIRRTDKSFPVCNSMNCNKKLVGMCLVAFPELRRTNEKTGYFIERGNTKRRCFSYSKSI